MLVHNGGCEPMNWDYPTILWGYLSVSHRFFKSNPRVFGGKSKIKYNQRHQYFKKKKTFFECDVMDIVVPLSHAHLKWRSYSAGKNEKW